MAYKYKKVEGVDSLFFYEEVFCNEVRKLQEEKFVDYIDEGCTLLIVKYNGQELDFSDYIIQDLLKLKSEHEFRVYMDEVIRFSGNPISISGLRKRLPVDYSKYKNILSFVPFLLDSISRFLNYLPS